MIKEINESIRRRINLDDETFALFNHSRRYLSSNLILKLLTLISVPILTRLLTPADYGVLALFNTAFTILAIIIGLNIQSAVYRYYFEDKKDFSNFLGSNLSFLVIISGVWLVIGILISNAIAPIFQLSSNLFILAILVSICNVFVGLYLNNIMMKKDSKHYFNITTIKTVALTALTILLVYLATEQKYMGGIIALLLVSILFAAYCGLKLFKEAKLKFEFRHIKYSLLFSIPLLPQGLSGVVLSFFDRVIIGQLTNLTDVGLYDFAYKVGMIQLMVVSSVTAAWTPTFYEYLNNKQTGKIVALVKKQAKVVFILALALILFSREIVQILASPEYYSALDIVPFIVFAYVFFFLYIIYSAYTFYRKKTLIYSVGAVISAGLNITLNYLLIPIYGYKIAAVTTLISYALLFFLHFFANKYILKEEVLDLKTFKLLIPITVIILSYLLLERIIDYYPLLVVMKFVLLFIAAFITFEKIKEKIMAIYKKTNKGK